jgi:hypothetical protein
MVAKKDPKGFYERLGVLPSATAEEIKKAYRHLAKYLHPDVNAADGAKAKFQALNDAYAVLSDPELRAAYDALQYTSREHQRPAPEMEPICCSSCGKVTAQPRSSVFWSVVSVLFLTTRTPRQGIFCSSCAREAALKASLTSALFGWWGFPWGLIWTPTSILHNAAGGHHSKEIDEKLVWYNALAFLSKGNLALAYALAQQARTARDTDVAVEAVRLIDHLRAAGVPPASLKNPWARSPLTMLAHLLLLAVVPGIIGLAAYFAENGVPRERPQSQAARPDPYRPSVPLSGPALDDPTQPTCPYPVMNGETLVKRNVWSSNDGHAIEIENGSGGNAIVKVRNAYTGALLVSFFVAKGSMAAITNVPDGAYRIQYALGGNLGIDCQSFARVMSASQFPEIETLTTNYTTSRYYKQRLSYTLFPVPHGNVRPLPLDIAAFNAE